MSPDQMEAALRECLLDARHAFVHIQVVLTGRPGLPEFTCIPRMTKAIDELLGRPKADEGVSSREVYDDSTSRDVWAIPMGINEPSRPEEAKAVAKGRWVPLEPTSEMYRATDGKRDAYGFNHSTKKPEITYETVQSLWKGMLATAPQPSEAVDKAVAWMHCQGNFREPSDRRLDDDELARGWTEYPLYAHPPLASQSEREDVVVSALNDLAKEFERQSDRRAATVVRDKIRALHGSTRREG